MFKIIQKASIEDSENCLSKLLINNFYENILSASYIEDELLSLIGRSLREEINQLKQTNQPQYFLNNSNIGKILEGLILKRDIQSFFNMILKGLIENLENGTENRNWNFDINLICEVITNFKNLKNDNAKNANLKNLKGKQNLNNSSNDTIDLSFRENDNDENINESNFIGKYIPDITKKDLITKLQKEKNENMKSYILKQLTEYGNDDTLYSNSSFIYEVYKSDEPTKVLNFYQRDFTTCTEFIIKIFNLLTENIHLIPHSIRYICKIISILIKQKFPNISIIELNAFIGEFFFGKIFNKIFLRPEFYALISSFIISKQTMNNIQMIIFIINKLVSGKFFTCQKDPIFTPFNWFFLLDSYPLVLDFFQNLTNVSLPSYIEKIINNPKNDDFYYNFFEENKNDFIFHKSICFSMYDFNTLFNIIKKNEDYFNEEPNIKGLNEEIGNKKLEARKLFNMTIKKLSMNVYLDDLNKFIDKEQKEKKRNYFLDYNIEYNKEFNDLMKIEMKKSQPNFTLPELKEIITDEDIYNNNLIKIQNFLCKILYNYRTLNHLDFSEGTTKDTISMINELMKYLKSDNFIIDNSIPSEWYAKSLLKLLKILPEDHKNNDFEKIYQNLTNDLNNSIKSLDFELLSQIFERLKYTEREKKSLDSTKKAINELEMNNLIKNFVETYNIQVELKINIKDKIFEIKKTNKNISEKISRINDYFFYKSGVICKTIFEFTKRFPPLIYYLEKQDSDLFELVEKLKIQEKLENYYKLIKETMIKYKPFSEYKSTKSFEKIYYKITSYIMSRIYDKIFPDEANQDDITIYHNCFKLSWIEPNHLIKKNIYLFDNFLPESKEILYKINKEKSPLQKLNCFIVISNKIQEMIKFQTGDELITIEDTIPILEYAIIKAQLFKFNSNLKYINIFLNKELLNSNLGHILSQIIIIEQHIKEITYNSLYNISNEEFEKKCKDAILIDMSLEGK